MKLGFIANNDLESVARDAQFAAEHGFEGLEFNFWANFADLTQERVTEMRALLDEHGATASALGMWGWNHIATDDDERSAAHSHLNRAIDLAQILGAHTVITGCGDIPDAPLDAKVDAFAEVMPAFIDRAGEAGLQISFYAVHGNSFLNSIEACEKVWERVPAAGLKFDPANWAHHGCDYLQIARHHADHISYFHIKEHVYMEGELVSQPAAGMGDIQWGKLFAFLHEADYRGQLSIEPHGPLWSKPRLRYKMLLLTKQYISQFLL